MASARGEDRPHLLAIFTFHSNDFFCLSGGETVPDSLWKMLFSALTLPMFLIFSGCGGGNEIPTAPVSGQVTMDGKPLANVSVTFQPITTAIKETGGGSFGKTDSEGRFELEFVTTGKSGAVVGEHRVSIVTPEPEEAKTNDAFKFNDPIPARYNRSSTLSFEVPADGTTEANFPLTSKKDALDKQ